jgi:hypothetical protein
MNSLLTLLAVMLPVAITFQAVVLASLSQRLGAVTHRAPVYRWFYLAAGFSSTSALIYLWHIAEGNISDAGGQGMEVVSYALPLLISVVISATVAWRYWGWLIHAREM